MQTNITGRHVDITDPLREHIEKKLGKLDPYSDHLFDARIVLSVEKYRQVAEITISARNNIRCHSREATDDMYVSIDKAMEKIERQLRKHTTKKRKTKRRKDTEPRPQPDDSEEEVPEPEEMFESHGPYRISISEEALAKPMSVKEAVMQLELSEEEFLAFVNEETDDVNVVFKKKEGGYGLLRRPF
jgi:putative sigma-54 modulation protein